MVRWSVFVLGIAVLFAGCQAGSVDEANVMGKTASFYQTTDGNWSCSAGNGVRMGYQWMRDADGNLLDRAAVEAKLDQAIADGLINEATKDYLLQNYDWCVANGGGNGSQCQSRGARGYGKNNGGRRCY